MLLLFILLTRTQNNKEEFEGDEDLSDYMEELYENLKLGESFTFKQEKRLEKLNIIVIGKTGVGKSTLINHIFRENFAETGNVRSVTQNIQVISKENYPLNIYDIPGFELDPKKQKEIIKEISKLFDLKNKTNDPNNFIHCIWYCISCPSKRIEDAEIRFIKKISHELNVPIIIVITQCYNDVDRDDMIRAIKKEKLPVADVIPVLAKNMIFKNRRTKSKVVYQSYGLNNLIMATCKILPKILQETLNNMNLVSVSKQKKMARILISIATTSSTVIGGKWIPYANYYLLIPNNLGMMIGINYIYKVNISPDVMFNVLKKTIGEIEIISRFFNSSNHQNEENTQNDYTQMDDNDTDEMTFYFHGDENIDNDKIDKDNINYDNINFDSNLDDENVEKDEDTSSDQEYFNNDWFDKIYNFIKNKLNGNILAMPVCSGILAKIYSIPKKIYDKVAPKIKSIYNLCLEKGKIYYPKIMKWFKKNNKKCIVSVSSAALTASLGESYRMLIEKIYLSNHAMSEEDIYNFMISSFSNQLSQE